MKIFKMYRLKKYCEEVHRVDSVWRPDSDWNGLYVDTKGSKAWYQNGKLHREDGPTIEYINGTKSWYLNGERHREDGPAIEYANGDKEWFQNGEPHREDGPAIEYANGTKYWYLNGKNYTEERWKENLKFSPLRKRLDPKSQKFLDDLLNFEEENDY